MPTWSPPRRLGLSSWAAPRPHRLPNRPQQALWWSPLLLLRAHSCTCKTDDGVSGAQIADVGPLPHLDHAMRPLSLFVHPTAGNDTNAGTTADLPLRTLMAAQQLLRLALAREPAQSVRVLLLPGHHRVPPGGLRLTSKDCPAGDHRVLWSGGGNISTVSVGDPVVGWRRALGRFVQICADFAISEPTLSAPPVHLSESRGDAVSLLIFQRGH